MTDGPYPFFAWGKESEKAVTGVLGAGVSTIPVTSTAGWSAGSFGFVAKSDDTGNQFLGPATAVVVNTSVSFGFATDASKGASATLWQPAAGQYAAMTDHFTRAVNPTLRIGTRVRVSDGGAASSLGIADPFTTLSIQAADSIRSDMDGLWDFLALRRAGSFAFAFWDDKKDIPACYKVYRITDPLEWSTREIPQIIPQILDLFVVSEDGYVV